MRRYLVCALALHVGAFLAFSRAPRPIATDAAPPQSLALLEIPITNDEVAPTPSNAKTGPSGGSGAGAANALAAASAGGSRSPFPNGQPSAPEVMTAAPASTGADWSFSGGAHPSAATIGLDGRNVLLSNGLMPPAGPGSAAAPEAPPGDPKADGAKMTAMMSTMLHDADVAKGLGASGPVITELESATRQSLIPVDSTGTFVVDADVNGDVIGVHASGSGGDASAWTELAAQLLKSMQGRKVHVPHGWNGVRMKVALDSHLALPSGARSGAQIDGLGMRGDLSDLGATSHRTIHAHVLDERPL